MKTLIGIIMTTVFSLSSTIAHSEEMEFFLFGYEYAQAEGEPFERTKTIKTGDHHCERDCGGEPTRTGYRIEINTDPIKEKITDAKLTCDSNICAFSKVVSVGHTDNLAWGTFDVWSRPMNWTLTATVVPLKPVTGAQKQLDNDFVQPGTVFLIDHDKSDYLAVDMEVIIPGLGKIKVDPSNPPKPYFKLITSSEVGSVTTYSILYQEV